MFRFVFNKLSPEAIAELAPFTPYNRKSPEAMAKSGNAYLELPDAQAVRALAPFIERWASKCQIQRLHKIVAKTNDTADGLAPPYPSEQPPVG